MHNNLVSELVDTMANIEYGLLVSIVLVLLLLVLVSVMNQKGRLGVLSYIIAVILLVPLTFQMSRLIGACHVSQTASTINEFVGVISPTISAQVAEYQTQEVGWFIFRRVLWSLLFIAVGGFGIRLTMVPCRRRSTASFDDYDSNASGTTGDFGF